MSDRDTFVEKDAELLDELAAGFAKVQVRPKMAGPAHAEKARQETELFQVRARKLTALAQRIRRHIAKSST